MGVVVSSGYSAFGNLSIDDLVFADGTTKWRVPGGNAMYAALGMAVWQAEAHVIAPFGSDYPMEGLDVKVDVSHSPRLPNSLRNWGLYEDDGSRHFIFRFATRNWEAFSPRASAVVPGLQVAAHLAPMPWPVQAELLATLRDCGTQLISIDFDDRDLANTGLPRVTELLRVVDLFLPSRQDAAAMFPGASPVEALRRLRELGPDVPLIGVKCGADGSIAHAVGTADLIRVPAVPVEVHDATGAGDTFCGGALVGFSIGGEAVDALLHGAVSASFCVETLGPAGLAGATPEIAEERLEALRQRVELQPI